MDDVRKAPSPNQKAADADKRQWFTTLKTWVHWVTINPLDEDQKEMASAINNLFSLLETAEAKLAQAQGGDPAAGDEEALELLDRATIYNNFTDPIGAAFFAGRQSLRAEYKGEDAKFIVEKYEQLDAHSFGVLSMNQTLEELRAENERFRHALEIIQGFCEHCSDPHGELCECSTEMSLTACSALALTAKAVPQGEIAAGKIQGGTCKNCGQKNWTWDQCCGNYDPAGEDEK